MDKKRIVWIDDNINTSIFKPYVDEFEDNGIEIIKIKSVTGIIERLIKEAENTLSAILVDIIMPSEDLDFGETKGGLRTGMVVLERIMEEDSLKSIPNIVVTNADDDIIREFCNSKRIKYLKKSDYFSEEFVKEVKEVIEDFYKNDEL
jgi:CheY-like chemotaxis protein